MTSTPADFQKDLPNEFKPKNPISTQGINNLACHIHNWVIDRNTDDLEN